MSCEGFFLRWRLVLSCYLLTKTRIFCLEAYTTKPLSKIFTFTSHIFLNTNTKRVAAIVFFSIRQSVSLEVEARKRTPKQDISHVSRRNSAFVNEAGHWVEPGLQNSLSYSNWISSDTFMRSHENFTGEYLILFPSLKSTYFLALNVASTESNNSSSSKQNTLCFDPSAEENGMFDEKDYKLLTKSW